MIKYIDFDGVIMDTETHLFDDFQSWYKNGLVSNDTEYVQLLDWYSYLKKCTFIKDSLEYIKSDDTCKLLGKVCSDQEADAKRRILKEVGYEKPCIFIPFTELKCNAVNPRGNILADDIVHNLEPWELAGGFPLYFNKDGSQKDPWGNTNTRFKTIKTLKLLRNIDESYFDK